VWVGVGGGGCACAYTHGYIYAHVHTHTHLHLHAYTHTHAGPKRQYLQPSHPRVLLALKALVSSHCAAVGAKWVCCRQCFTAGYYPGIQQPPRLCRSSAIPHRRSPAASASGHPRRCTGSCRRVSTAAACSQPARMRTAA
jgi:hypothetical protein